MENSKSIVWQKIISLSLVVLGTLGFIFTQKLLMGGENFETIRSGFYVIVPLALGWYAHTKGRSIIWGLPGLLPFVGPIAALFTLHLNLKPSVSSERLARNIVIWGFAFIMMGGVIPVTVFNIYMKNIKTEQGLYHTRLIHQSLVEWQANPEAPEGGLQVTIDSLGKDGNKFSEQFPKEAGWLKSGDHNYSYKVDIVSDEVGKRVPRVTATAENAEAVKGDVIVSLPNGEVEVRKVYE